MSAVDDINRRRCLRGLEVELSNKTFEILMKYLRPGEKAHARAVIKIDETHIDFEWKVEKK